MNGPSPNSFADAWDCQRQLSRQDDPTGYVRAVPLMQTWTVALDYADTDVLIAVVTRTNALERSRAHFKLLMPDGTPVRLPRPAAVV